MCCDTKCTKMHGQTNIPILNRFLRIERTGISTNPQNTPQGHLIHAAGTPGVLRF